MDRRTLVEHLYSWARQQPDKTAIVHNNTPHSYADFVRAIAVTRDRLAGSAGPPGSTAILLASDLFQSWCATLALQSLGLRTISVRSLDQAAVLRVDNCACVVASAADGSADGVGQYEWPGAKVVALPSDLYLGIRSGDLPAPPEGSPRFANHILYTSGTTGSYKKLVLDCASDEDRFATLARHYEITHGSVFHASRFGLWTAVGYAMAAAAWLVGGSVITDQRTDYLDGLFRHGATCVFLLPPDLSALLDSRATDAARLAGVEVLTAGGFLPPNVAEEFSHRVADVTVDRKSTRLNSSHVKRSRMPSSA